MAKIDWHHFDFGDHRTGVTPIDGLFALLFLVEDIAYRPACYPNEHAAREGLRVLGAGMDALPELKQFRKREPAAKPRAKAKATAKR